MSLTIEGKLKVERINNPNDFYLYFNGGCFVWNYEKSQDMGLWLNGQMFSLYKEDYDSIQHLHQELTQWVQQMNHEHDEWLKKSAIEN